MQKCWKCADGELSVDSKSSIWVFKNKTCQIFITSWYDSEKGPMTEIVYESSKRQIIIDCLEKKPNKLFYEPKYFDEASTKVIKICETLLNMDQDSSDYFLVTPLQESLEKMIEHLSNIKCFHAYHGNGLFFGLSVSRSRKTKFLETVPRRCMEFPGTRLDSLSD